MQGLNQSMRNESCSSRVRLVSASCSHRMLIGCSSDAHRVLNRTTPYPRYAEKPIGYLFPTVTCRVSIKLTLVRASRTPSERLSRCGSSTFKSITRHTRRTEKRTFHRCLHCSEIHRLRGGYYILLLHNRIVFYFTN